MAATEYKVFVKADDSDTWSPIGPDVVEASSADTAIRSVAATRETSGTYAAVPARSWQPRTVKVESKPKVTFS